MQAGFMTGLAHRQLPPCACWNNNYMQAP